MEIELQWNSILEPLPKIPVKNLVPPLQLLFLPLRILVRKDISHDTNVLALFPIWYSVQA